MSEKKPICVIEDNKPIRKLFCTLLKKNGFETVDFGDGKSAIDWLKDNNPYGVIVDILLPDLNGGEVLEFIRSKDGGDNIPVIAATGFAQSKDREKFIQQGFDGYISKPINTGSFVSEVKEIFDSK